MSERDLEPDDFYERYYASFAGHPGYVSETRYVERLLGALERRGLVSLGHLRSHADLGCGLGFKTYAVARHFERSVGFDASGTATELATRLNDLPALEFRTADVFEFEPGERFDFVTAFGLSALNSRDPGQTSERIAALADHYLADGGVFLVVTQTDCSGEERAGWYNPDTAALRRVASAVAMSGAYASRLYTPQRDLLAHFGYGAEHTLRELAKRMLRGRRDYCLLVSRR
jgi:SAM-dependent methyltransferase